MDEQTDEVTTNDLITMSLWDVLNGYLALQTEVVRLKKRMT